MLAGAALAAWRLGWRAGLLVLVGLALMGANEVFKDVVGRPRPLDPGPWGCDCESFPSGHTLHAVLTSGLLWLLVMPRLTQATHRRMMLAVLLVWPVLVGISRVHLERHWPSDVLGAYVFGAALLIVMAWVWPKVAPVRPRIEYGAGSGPVDTISPEPVEGQSLQQEAAPSGPVAPVRPEPVEGPDARRARAHSEKTAIAQRTPFYYGWVIVAFGFVFGAFNVGMTSWGLGVFVTPMQEDLEWDRSLVFLPLLVGAIVTTPLGIIVGPWADTKNGPRILALAGILLFGASLLYMKVAGSELGYIFIFGIVGGLGRFSVAMALVVVPKWFVRRRGLAQATVSAGFSVGPLIFPLILQALVESVGWRDAWFIMGIALIVLAGPGAFFIIRSPEDVGLRPTATATTPSPPAPGARGAPPGRGGRVTAGSEVSLTRREALHTSQFWMLVVAIGLATLAIRGMIPNFQPFFISLGFDATTAAASISAYAVPAIVMGFVFGSLADRHGPQRPFLAVCSIVASGLFLVSLTSQFQSTGMMFASMIYLGFGLNAFFVVSQVFVANTFGRQHLGAIRGMMQTVNNLATFGGPWIFGLLFDIYADYAMLFGFAVVVWLVTIVLGGLVRPLRRPAAPISTTSV